MNAYKKKFFKILIYVPLVYMTTSCENVGTTYVGSERKWIGSLQSSRTDRCSGACREKIDIPGGGERCVKFSAGMADICFATEVAKGTLSGVFVLSDPKQ